MKCALWRSQNVKAGARSTGVGFKRSGVAVEGFQCM